MEDKEILQKILSKMDGIDDQLKGINNRLGNVEGQLDENTQIVKALLHRTEELDAKFDGLLHTVATIESVNQLKSSVELLNTRLFQQETKLNSLSVVK